MLYQTTIPALLNIWTCVHRWWWGIELMFLQSIIISLCSLGEWSAQISFASLILPVTLLPPAKQSSVLHHSRIDQDGLHTVLFSIHCILCTGLYTASRCDDPQDQLGWYRNAVPSHSPFLLFLMVVMGILKRWWYNFYKMTFYVTFLF